MVSIQLIVYLAVLSLTTMNVNACTCSPDHPQQDFCVDDFVVKLYVETATDIMKEGYVYPWRIKYTVNITHVYKSTDAFENANTTYLMVPGAEWHCKLDLETGKEYVITGRVYRNRGGVGWHMYTTMCDFNMPYSQLSETQKTFLNYTYSQNCQCRVKKCYPSNDFCIDNKYDDECVFVDTPENRERDINRFCTVENGNCQWRSGQNRERPL